MNSERYCNPFVPKIIEVVEASLNLISKRVFQEKYSVMNSRSVVEALLANGAWMFNGVCKKFLEKL